jgi:hypothetical protein
VELGLISLGKAMEVVLYVICNRNITEMPIKLEH